MRPTSDVAQTPGEQRAIPSQPRMLSLHPSEKSGLGFRLGQYGRLDIALHGCGTSGIRRSPSAWLVVRSRFLSLLGVVTGYIAAAVAVAVGTAVAGIVAVVVVI